MSERALLIVNPAAGKRHAEDGDLAECVRLLTAAGFDIDRRETGTDGPSSADLAKTAIAEGFRVVLVAGGDGTVAPAAIALLETDVTLGILPFGSFMNIATTPTTAYRGAGRPNVCYLAERLVEEAARELKIDRVELRRRNLIPKDAFPYQTPHPHSQYDSGDPHGMLDEALKQGEWDSFEARRSEAKKRGKLRGIGCAVFVEPAGAGGAPKEEAMIKFGESGSALLYVLAGPSGQGHETVYPEVVGEALGMDPEKITLRASDPDGPALIGEGTIGSRSMMAHGGALLVAAREVVRKGTELAAKDLEVAATDLEFSKGRYRVKGTDISIGVEDLAKKHGSALDSGGEIPLPRSYPSGAHVVEVEIDAETGVLDIRRYTAVDDCGRVINHVLLEGQLHGGIAQGLGQALGEHAIYDEVSGQLLTGTFMDYPMPRADDMPEIRLYDRSIPSPGNPLGAKGAGEAGTTGAVPAVANAVIDALRPLGIHHLDFPYTPDRLWHAIRAAKNFPSP